jgi:hypothetical protein
MDLKFSRNFLPFFILLEGLPRKPLQSVLFIGELL